VCAGKLVVQVVDGFGVVWNVACDACGLGFEGPRGYTNEYLFEPGVEEFVPVRVTSMTEGDWYVADKDGHQTNVAELFATAEEALAVSVKRSADVVEENHRRRAARSATMLKKKTWHLSYHAKCIKDLERQLEWHRAKVSEQKG
jgi:hypothetical protein